MIPSGCSLQLKSPNRWIKKLFWGEELPPFTRPCPGKLVLPYGSKEEKKTPGASNLGKALMLPRTTRTRMLPWYFFMTARGASAPPKRRWTIQSTYVDLWNRQFITAPRWLWNGLNLVIWPWDHEIMRSWASLNFFHRFTSFSFHFLWKMAPKERCLEETRPLQTRGCCSLVGSTERPGEGWYDCDNPW